MRASRIILWWFGLMLTKYALIALASEWIWSEGYSFINNLLLAPLIAGALLFVFALIMDKMGISLIDAVSSGASDEKYVRTTYEGQVERGMFGDRVKVTPKSEVTSDRLEMSSTLLMIVFAFDTLCLYLGWIQEYLPFPDLL